MIKHITLSVIASLFTATMTYPVTAQELSSKDKKIIQEYNQSIQKGRRQFNEYSVPICEFAHWYSESQNEPECGMFLWPGWCWVNKEPSIQVYDKPDGKVINALKGGRLLTPEEEAGDKISIHVFADNYFQVGRWAKVFGPYKNQYRYWGWIKRTDIDCEP